MRRIDLPPGPRESFMSPVKRERLGLPNELTAPLHIGLASRGAGPCTRLRPTGACVTRSERRWCYSSA